MADRNCTLVAVIMAGGAGTRFWPSSQKRHPKQYLRFFGEHSLIQQTASRIAPLTGNDHLYICSTESQRALLREHLNFLPESHFFMEPEGKNTAPAIALSAIMLLRQGYAPETPMVVLPADHHIGDEEGFRECVTEAVRLAKQQKGLVTLGIIPTIPHTGYGYIEAGDKLENGKLSSYRIKQFVEKPDKGRAEKYVMSGKFYWNGGIFLWTLETIRKAFLEYLPETWLALEKSTDAGKLATAYGSLPSVAIDVAIMEKATNGYVIPASIRWSDVGSWNAVYDLNVTTAEPQSDLAKGVSSNVILKGDVLSVESRSCLVKVPDGKKVALVGVEGLIIVDDGDKLLICRRESDQLVRKAALHFDA